MSTITLERVTPQAGVRGGRVAIYCQGLVADTLDTCQVVFGSTPTRPALTSSTLVLGTVPANADADGIHLVQEGRASNAIPFSTATRLADNLHPVANPAIDRAGAIYTTISGTKDQQVPVSIYRITPAGETEPFASGIINATGLAFGPDGDLYVSSRHTGKVLRVNAHGTVSTAAERLGTITGLAFDSQGRLHAGDRRGTIYQLSDSGEPRTLAKLEPSVAAYHLAFDEHDRLYVSYPTLSGYDCIYAITPDGEVRTVARELGRAQGVALDRHQNLYVVSHVGGEGGVVRITPAGDIEQIVAASNLVGLAFSMDNELILADNSSLYKLGVGA